MVACLSNTAIAVSWECRGLKTVAGETMGVAKELMMETGPDVEIAFVCPLCRGSASSWIQEPDTDYEEGEGDTFIEQAKCWNPKCQAKWGVELYATNGRV